MKSLTAWLKAASQRVRGLNQRDRHALAFGAVIAVPALAYSFAVKPYIAALSDTRAAVEQERALLLRERALLAAAPRFAEERRTLVQLARTANARLFAGEDVIEATSALSSYVGGVMRTANLAVQQIESRDAGDSSRGLREISIDLRAEGGLDAVLRALRALESGPRLVRVTRVNVERAPSSSVSGAPESLIISATLRAYARAADGVKAQ